VCSCAFHQEQVPRKQGLKLRYWDLAATEEKKHQEQVPRKQGLKRITNADYIDI